MAEDAGRLRFQSVKRSSVRWVAMEACVPGADNAAAPGGSRADVITPRPIPVAPVQRAAAVRGVR